MSSAAKSRSTSHATWLLTALALFACQDHTPPEPPTTPEDERPSISVAYVCGNRFEIQNRESVSATVRYAVTESGEEGELLLPARLRDDSASTTRLVTLTSGTLHVLRQDETISSIGNAGTGCPPPQASEPGASLGQWDPPFFWPVVAVHLHLLPNGQVLSWGAVGAPQVWDPASGEFTGAISSTDLFCSGHTFLPDGRLLVTGGHISPDHGLPDANLFDPASRTWSPVAAMSKGRWYPTSTTLADGTVLTLAGRDQQGIEVEVPEFWTGTGWRALPGARRVLPYYPRAFVAPNGLVFYAGELKETSYLDPVGEGRWTPVATSNYGRRDYGSAVMYRPGKVLIVGGSDPPDGVPTSTAEIIDLEDGAPAWRYTQPMHYARRQFNTTLLPDGRVLATGGTTAGGFTDPAGAVHSAELWDPATEAWSVLANNQVTRVYHSSSLLLADGRVLHAGSGDGGKLPRELTAELYSPPYLFRGPRPTITAAPEAIGYGESFTIMTADAGHIVRVTLVRLGSVTHSFDQNQRFLDAAFRRSPGGLTVSTPVTANLAPPGHYLLFTLSDIGVPSTGQIVQLH